MEAMTGQCIKHPSFGPPLRTQHCLVVLGHVIGFYYCLFTNGKENREIGKPRSHNTHDRISVASILGEPLFEEITLLVGPRFRFEVSLYARVI